MKNHLLSRILAHQELCVEVGTNQNYDIVYDDLLRNPEKYEGTPVMICCQVTSQPNENYSEKTAFGDSKRNWSTFTFFGNKVHISYKDSFGDFRIIKDDEIVVYGMFEGLTTFKSLAGPYDVPDITVYYYEPYR